MKAVVLGIDFGTENVRRIFYVPDSSCPGGPMQMAEEVLPQLERTYPRRVWTIVANEEAKRLWEAYMGQEFKEK